MLSYAGRGTIPATTALSTFTQSLVYITVSPIIGNLVAHFGSYQWVMVGAGLWVIPGVTYWLVRTSKDQASVPLKRKSPLDR
jgi:hypothetical protein